MCDFIDIDAGKIIEGARADDVADEIFELLLDVCNRAIVFCHWKLKLLSFMGDVRL